MSNLNEYLALKKRIKELEEQYPNLIILAFKEINAKSSNSIGRPKQDAPLEKVIYKKKSDQIWLVLKQRASWSDSKVVWQPTAMSVGVVPTRLRLDDKLVDVTFEEVDH